MMKIKSAAKAAQLTEDGFLVFKEATGWYVERTYDMSRKEFKKAISAVLNDSQQV